MTTRHRVNEVNPLFLHCRSKPRKPSLLPAPGLRKMPLHIDTGRESPCTPPTPVTIPSSPSVSGVPTSSTSTPTLVQTPTPPPSSTPTPAPPPPPPPPVVSSPAPTATSVPTSVILQSPGKTASADARPPHSSPPKPFLASQMLDRIITASLGNFPSSGEVPMASPRHLESSPKLEGAALPKSQQQQQLARTLPSNTALRLTPSYGFMEAFKRTLEQSEPPTSSGERGKGPYYKPDNLEGMKGFPYPVGYMPTRTSSAVVTAPDRPRPHVSVAQQPQPQHWRQRPTYPPPSASYPQPPRPYPFPSQSHGSKGASQGQGHVS